MSNEVSDTGTPSQRRSVVEVNGPASSPLRPSATTSSLINVAPAATSATSSDRCRARAVTITGSGCQRRLAPAATCRRVVSFVPSPRAA